MAFRSMYFAIKCEADANPDLEQWEWLGGESRHSGKVDVILALTSPSEYSRKNPIKGDDKVARKAVKEVLEDRDFSTDELLKLLTNEYWYDLHKENQHTDADTILCSALADFFWRYKEELGINIQRTEGKRTLCKPLQELYSFLVGRAFPIGPPEYRNRKQGILKGSNRSVEAVLEAVRHFLITKANEGSIEIPSTSVLLPQPTHPSPANTVTPGPEKAAASESTPATIFAPSEDLQTTSLTTALQNPHTDTDNQSKALSKNTLLPKHTLKTSLEPELPDKLGASEAFKSAKTQSELQTNLTRASTTCTKESVVTAGTVKDDLKKDTPIQPSLKRKREESSSNVLAKLRRNAKDVELMWRAQNDEMERLELIESDRKNEGQEIQALRARVQQLEEQVKSNQMSRKDVSDAISEKIKAQGEARRARYHNRLLETSERELRQERDDTKKELGGVQRERDVIKTEIDVANRKASSLEKEAEKADRERVEVWKQLKVAINLKNGMKKMLMVAGPNLCFGSTFTSETIDDAAVAVVEGKCAKTAVTDMIRAAMC